MKKRILLIVLVAVMVLGGVFALTACTKIDSGQDLERVLERGELRVGMECNYAPFNWTQNDESNGAVPIKSVNGKYANGYDVKIAKKIAEALDVDLVIYRIDEFSALIPALNAGTIDAIIAGMSPMADRRLTTDFSNYYYYSNLVIVVKQDGRFANATSLADFKNQSPEANIVAQLGTFHLEALEQIRDVKPEHRYATFPAMMAALDSNMIEGYIAEEPGAITNCIARPNYKYIQLVNNSTGFNMDPDDVALSVGMRKNSSLTARVNEILAGISESDRNSLMQDAMDEQPLAN